MKKLSVAFIAGLLFLFSSLAARADGVLNAVAYRPMVANPTITVSPLDDSDENMRLKTIFEERLQALGYKVSNNSHLVFTFETRGQTGSWSGSQRSIVEFEGHGRGGKDYQKTRLNIFDSGKGALLNEGNNTVSSGNPTQYRIDVTLDDRKAKNRVWQGWATANLELTDGEHLVQAMIPILAENLGKTVRRKPFEINLSN